MAAESVMPALNNLASLILTSPAFVISGTVTETSHSAANNSAKSSTTVTLPSPKEDNSELKLVFITSDGGTHRQLRSTLEGDYFGFLVTPESDVQFNQTNALGGADLGGAKKGFPTCRMSFVENMLF